MIPTGIATDATTQDFFKNLVLHESLAALYDFENEEKIFPGADHRVRFALLTLTGTERPSRRVDLVFRVRQAAQIPTRAYSLTPEEISLLNPNTGTCPVFYTRRDAEITLGIYRRIPVLWRESSPDGNPWQVSFLRMFDMANDSDQFKTADDLKGAGWILEGNTFTLGDEQMLPLYEAKMAHYFDYRLGTYKGATQAQLNVGVLPRLDDHAHDDPMHLPIPRYWVAGSRVDARLSSRWTRDWLLGWRDICRSTDERTLITAAIPRTAVGHKFLLMLPEDCRAGLYANLTTFALDYVVRQKLSGTSLGYFVLKQLPVLAPNCYDKVSSWDSGRSLEAWVRARVLELSYTAYDLAGYARDLGDNGGPFRWVPERREVMRAELDAAYFHLYGVERNDVDYIMDTFKVVKEKDEARHGEYRTKRLILERYDALAKAMASGEPYKPPLDPPPGHGPRHPVQGRGGE